MIGSEGQRTGPGSIILFVITTGVLTFLTAPILVVALVSFSSAETLSFPPPSFSLRWYTRLFSQPAWLQSIWVSTQIAIIAAVVATTLGFLTAMAIVREKFRGKSVVIALTLSPMIIPTIITAVALYFIVVKFRMQGSMIVIALGHAMLALPVATIVTSAALQALDRRVELASYSLGGGRFATFRHILLPQMIPGLISAWVFSFLTSFDELLIPLFLGGRNVETLSARIWNSLLLEVDPIIAAISTLLIACTAALLVGLAFVRRAAASR